MAISRIQAVSAQAATVSFTAPALGDVIIVVAHRDGSTTQPTIPATYQKVTGVGANSNSAIVGYRISDGTETSTGTWTNATSIAAGIYRGVDPNTPIGKFATWTGSVATGGNMSYPALTMFRGVGYNTSWVVGVGTSRSGTNLGTNAPSGMYTQSSATDIAVFDTNGTVTAWSAQTAAITASATSYCRTYTIELLQRNTSTLTVDPLVQCVSTMPTSETGNTWTCLFPNATLANNLLVIAMSWSHGKSVSSVSDANGAWTAGPSVNGDGTNTIKDSAIYYKAGAASTTSVTVTLSGTVASFHFVLCEFKGPATSSVVDGTATATDNVLNASGMQPGSITTTVDGDLIFNYCSQAFVDLWQSNSVYCIGLSADPALRFLAASRAVYYGAQYGIQATHGAINPIMVAKLWNGADVVDIPFQSLCIAFKTDGSGTSPSAGIRIIRSHTEEQPEDGRSSSPIQFTSSGNLIVGYSSSTLLNTPWTVCRDSIAGAWTTMHADEAYDDPQGFYLANATAAVDRYIYTTWSGTARHWMRFYDITGAHTSPYDTSAHNEGALPSPNQPISNNPSITPGTANGLVFACMSMGDGPVTSLTSPSSAAAFFESHRYTGETDAGYMNEGDGFAHYYNPSTSTVNFSWTTGSPTNSAWQCAAFSFKAAPTVGIFESGPIKLQAINRASTY